jgi:hypothetical protein
VSEALIEHHEEAADRALAMTLAAGLVAAAALLAVRVRRERAIRILFAVALVGALASAGMMAQVAHLGGQIRHEEIRPRGAAGPSSRAAHAGAEADDDD